MTEHRERQSLRLQTDRQSLGWQKTEKDSHWDYRQTDRVTESTDRQTDSLWECRQTDSHWDDGQFGNPVVCCRSVLASCLAAGCASQCSVDRFLSRSTSTAGRRKTSTSLSAVRCTMKLTCRLHTWLSVRPVTAACRWCVLLASIIVSIVGRFREDSNLHVFDYCIQAEIVSYLT